MLSVEKARQRILEHARLTDVERVPLERAAGRVPASFEVIAAVDVPPFANSSMDGYALRAADAPGELRVVGKVAAGGSQLPTIGPGQAVSIMTGAPVPPGADAVVAVEDAVVLDDGRVQVPATTAGAYVRPAAHDIAAGDLIELPSGPLTPASIAVLASLGLGEVAVRRPPMVAILSTGNELASPGATLAPGQIHDANSVALAAAVRAAGGEARLLERAPDDPAAIERLLTAGVAEADLLVASGGVSVGQHDHLRAVVERLGTLDFWRIRVQPGKPLAYGSVAGRPVIGLPGNPVSALVTFELFVRPLIRAMLGLGGDGRQHVSACLDERITKDAQRRAYLRVVLRRGPDGWLARGAGGQGSAQLRPMAAANALLVVPEGEPAGEAGQTYDAILIGEVP